jgi:hypothetical protein
MFNNLEQYLPLDRLILYGIIYHYLERPPSIRLFITFIFLEGARQKVFGPHSIFLPEHSSIDIYSLGETNCKALLVFLVLSLTRPSFLPGVVGKANHPLWEKARTRG